MQSLKSFCYIATLALLCLPASAQAESATLARGLTDPLFYPGGYNGAADNNIFYYAASGAPGHKAYPEKFMRTSDGAFGVGMAANGSTSMRSLIRFDLSGMSGQSVTVTSDATLSLRTLSEEFAPFQSYGLYQIAPENAGWVESTNNAEMWYTPGGPAVLANNGDPTWYYKHIDTVNNTDTSTAADDTTSEKWYSAQQGHVDLVTGPYGSNPEGYPNTGGLWNPFDLVDADPTTPVSQDPAQTYLDMAQGKMDPVATAPWFNDSTMTFTIPAAMIQDWIDNPSENAGFLARATNSGAIQARFFTSESDEQANRPTISFSYDLGAVAGDFDGDGDVDGSDLTDAAVGWEARYGSDLDGSDFLTWQRNYGFGTPQTSSVPEPSSLILLTSIAVGLLCRNRRRVA